MCYKCEDTKCTIATDGQTCCICTNDIMRTDWCEECIRRNEVQIDRKTYAKVIMLLETEISRLDQKEY